MTATNTHLKSGYVTIAGRPNVGKSTLINSLLQFRLSVVTPKPQTTRHRILGILSGPHYQVIFYDTPGLIEPHYRLQEAMVKAARQAIDDADVLIFMLDATRDLQERELETCRQLVSSKTPFLLLINKIDLVSKSSLLPTMDHCARELGDVEIIPISALTGDGLEELKATIVNLLPQGSPFYPEDQLTEHPERFFVSEIIRGHIFQQYGEEIPYATTVQVDEFREREGGKDYINARIVVERQSQKAILIGKGGRAIKDIGQRAREEIEQLLGRQVFLELRVVVREKWRSKETHLKEFGYK